MNNKTIYDGPGQLVNQRSGLPIQIERSIIFDWLPIIGGDGLAIYSYYVALADNGAAFPGIRTTAAHIGISRDRVQLNNKVLAWSGLLRIESGHNPAGPNLSNRYIIDNVPPCTPAALQYIAARATADPVMSSRPAVLRRQSSKRPPGLLDRIESWTPANQRPIWTSTGPTTATLPEDRLVALGLNPKRVESLISLIPPTAEPGLLNRCLHYIEQARQLPPNDPRYVRNAEAYLRTLLESGEEPALAPTINPDPEPPTSDPAPGMRSI